ncbi:hypothetical protein ACFDR9_004497 [Janthinobacterium sp. CG_23.3]|uniref:hypothetical protein n=1 Tax=Janthinobacterium sp. CG_23.3 TaxID=3349634 RepID=UPI0038D4F670
MTKKTKIATVEKPVVAPGVMAAKLALKPSVNAAAVMESYQANVHGKDVDINVLIDGLRDSFNDVNGGDLSTLEAMLIGQATALQSIFTSLARRAQTQEYQKNLESFLGLALKAQAQSRATIQAVIDLKFPRQVAFVKQANISHGPQQVNNGTGAVADLQTRLHAEENQTQQSKLLEDKSHERTYLDAGTTTTTSRGDPALATVEAVHRTDKRQGQG